LNKLPDNVGDLIRLALKDLEACEANPSYKVDMTYWHLYDESDDICYVCLAGSVMAQRLGVEHVALEEIYPSTCGADLETTMKLKLLNQIRHAKDNSEVLSSYFDNTNVLESGELFDVTAYVIDSEKFKLDMLRLADVFDKFDTRFTKDPSKIW